VSINERKSKRGRGREGERGREGRQLVVVDRW